MLGKHDINKEESCINNGINLKFFGLFGNKQERKNSINVIRKNSINSRLINNQAKTHNNITSLNIKHKNFDIDNAIPKNEIINNNIITERRLSLKMFTKNISNAIKKDM